jgi:hypothetical protein
MKKSLLTFILIFFLFSTLVKGQISMRQAGLRMGYSSGIFYQASARQGNAEIAYNAMLGFRKNGIQLTGLKIVYETPFDRVSRDLHFSWGYGGHIGYLYSDHVKFMGEDYYFPGERFCPLFGIDGWVSAEYRIHEIPLNISLNYKPFVEMTIPSFLRVVPWDFAISVSYVF